jgi:hypothetical protein
MVKVPAAQGEHNVLKNRVSEVFQCAPAGHGVGTPLRVKVPGGEGTHFARNTRALPSGIAIKPKGSIATPGFGKLPTIILLEAYAFPLREISPT